MEKESFNKIKNGGDEGDDWDMSEVEFAGDGKEAELEKMHREWRMNQGLEPETDEEKPGEDINVEAVEEEQVSGQAEDLGDKKWTAFVKGTAEADELKKDESLLLFLTSADGGYAVKKTEAVETFVEGVKDAKSDKDFYEAQRLGLTIQNDKGDFAEEDVQKMTDFMQTPLYQKKLYSYNVEQNKKIIEKKNDDLQRCMDEVAREKKGGFFKRLLNRRAIKEAERRAEMVRNGIRDAEESLVYYADKLKKLGGEEEVLVNEKLDTNAPAKGTMQKSDEKLDTDALVESIVKKHDEELDTDALVESLINPDSESKAA